MYQPAERAGEEGSVSFLAAVNPGCLLQVSSDALTVEAAKCSEGQGFPQGLSRVNSYSWGLVSTFLSIKRISLKSNYGCMGMSLKLQGKAPHSLGLFAEMLETNNHEG